MIYPSPSRSARVIELLRARGSRRVLLIATTAAAAVLIATGFAVASQSSSVLRYRGYVTANPQRGACYERVGLYVGLQAQIPRRMPAAELKKLAAANMPKNTVVKIGRQSYRLAVDAKTSAFGNQQVGWNFRLVKLDKRTALKLIGQRATVSYKLGSKDYKTKPVLIQDGRCKSLI